MNPLLVEFGLGALSVGAWFVLYGLTRLATRARDVDAQPATPELGAEPPAVVNLLANGWKLTEDAAEATLLDLGARRVLEFRQPSDNPAHTTVHIREKDPAGLTAYERRVFNRVAGLAVDGVVPLTALTFRDPRKAQHWQKRLRAEVVADARARGLSRPRFGPHTAALLLAAAVVSALGVASGVLYYQLHIKADDPLEGALAMGAATFIALALVVLRPQGERDTPQGRAAAARWLGVREWLRGHEAFADLPPSAVTVWDRYLAYGAALGTTRTASAVIHLGMGNRKQPWSSYGGTWHRVRVRYPRASSRYGRTAPALLLRALVVGAAGFLLPRVANQLSGLGILPTWLSVLVPVACVALLAYGAYIVVRVVVDLAKPATVTGQVLWKEIWRQEKRDDRRSPVLYYLAVDDGRGDRTTAWGLPAALAGRCDTGDTVTMAVRPWSRRITSLTVDERGGAGHADGGEPMQEHRVALPLLAGTDDIPKVTKLLTPQEVASALGFEVELERSPTFGPFRVAQFGVRGRGTVLMVQVSSGLFGLGVWRAASRGQRLDLDGNEAWLDTDRIAVRRDDVTLVLTLTGVARGRGVDLAWLARRALARMQAGQTAEPV